MFFSNVFSLSSRRAVCQLAYRATRRDLRRRLKELEPVLGRSGITVRRDVLDEESRDLWRGVGLPGPHGPRPRGERVTDRLSRALDRLEQLAAP
jgi:hypothetical protein